MDDFATTQARNVVMMSSQEEPIRSTTTREMSIPPHSPPPSSPREGSETAPFKMYTKPLSSSPASTEKTLIGGNSSHHSTLSTNSNHNTPSGGGGMRRSSGIFGSNVSFNSETNGGGGGAGGGGAAAAGGTMRRTSGAYGSNNSLRRASGKFGSSGAFHASSDHELMYSNHDEYDDLDDLSSVNDNEIPKDTFEESESFSSDCEELNDCDLDGGGGGSSNNLDASTRSMKRRRKAALKNGGSRMVYVVLVIAALGFSFATYYLLNAANQQEFLSEFESYARETAEIAENNAGNTFGQLRSLATAITSVAIDTGIYGFPNVTIPHFDLRAQEIQDLTGAEMIMFVPFVEKVNREGFVSYARDHQSWIEQDYEYRDWDTSALAPFPIDIHECTWCYEINDTRRGYVDTGFMSEILHNRTFNGTNFSAPITQYGPAPIHTDLALFDLYSHPIFKKEMIASLEYDVPVISEPTNLEFLLENIFRNATEVAMEDEAEENDDPFTGQHSVLRSFTLDQVKEDFREDSRTIGYLVGVLKWDTFFADILPESIDGVVIKVVSDCGNNFTYVVNGGKDDWSAYGDWHDSKYEDMRQEFKFFWKFHPKGTSRHCHFDFHVYPSDDFYANYHSDEPVFYACMVLVVFVFTAIVFFLYNIYVSKKQSQVVSQAERAEAIVTSVFPRDVGLRLIKEAEEAQEQQKKKKYITNTIFNGGMSALSSKRRLSNFLVNGSGDNNGIDNSGVVGRRSKPIADLFPTATVMFADITGFTAWSSTREPSMVFILLESIYNDFDEIAKRRSVFKVETVGDCYVAVSGLPNPNPNHDMVMALFAADCLTRFGVLVRQLEIELGPDTAELGIRIGLHSGPVTAGVLRGERARFQLFGDTVNTTARIESTGYKNRIQLSQETASLLEARGKSHWFVPREDKVTAKGKGELQTYWLKNIRGAEGRSVVSAISKVSGPSSNDNASAASPQKLSASVRTTRNGRDKVEKLRRLVDWNTDLLVSLLQLIEQRRRFVSNTSRLKASAAWNDKARQSDERASGSKQGELFDEVREIIELPQFNANTASRMERNQEQFVADIDPRVQSQVREYVSMIASMYNENHFHNFEHASHVTMSVGKLLSRIVAPDIGSEKAKDLHDHTYGITSDPLTQFAVVFSAMLHDVEHLGVPNTTLVNENAEIAIMYKNKSVAEQNSIDISWHLLMEDKFKDFRDAIYSTKEEFKRFRQLVVNTILATDIMDKELKSLRNARWEKAFAEPDVSIRESVADTVNRKATIVIEHLIQASDVAHTMQHWHIYLKWNERFFKETYKAYLEGRADKNPVEGWYEGELGFFDYYIIPLAKKLKDCGVFGVSCDEYLNYAMANRKEWELKGKKIVKEYEKGFLQREKKEPAALPTVNIRRSGESPAES